MTRLGSLAAAPRLALLLVSACVASPEGECSSVGDAPNVPPLEVNALNGNALNGNALNGNALNGNALDGNGLGAAALVPSMLSATRLDPAGFSDAALAALRDPGPAGDLSRSLLKYTVGCAFETSRSFRLDWIDEGGVTHEKTYAGLLGLAPDWADHPLDESGQRWVSACLISRVNRFQIPVQLSSRGALEALAASSSETLAFPRLEGAFWGNVFDETQAAYACSFPPNDAHSQSLYRTCASTYVNASGEVETCSIIQPLGSCASACGALDAGGRYGSCSGGGGRASWQVVTVYLQ